MKRFRLLGVALLAVLAVGVVMSASAFALPELLPIKAGGSTFTGKNDSSVIHLETGKKETIECSAATANGTATNDTTGTFHITFTGCKEIPLGVACNSLGDASGSILTLGTFDNVFDTLSPLGEAILFLIEPVHIECTALALIQVTNELVCLWLEGLTSMATHLFHCNQTTGVQEDTGFYNDSGTFVKSQLSCSKNGGAAEACGELALAEVTFPEPVAFMND